MNRSTAARLAAFTLDRFRPQLYLTYGVLWALALESSAVLLAGRAGVWPPPAVTAVLVASVVLVLLFLRMLDECKDLPYDRIHHPDRPLVTGAISVTELRGAMIVLAVLLVALNAVVSLLALWLIVADLAYGLLLAAVERRFPALGERPVADLLLAYPVQLLLSGYLYVVAADEGGFAAGWRGVPLVAVFACVFLHFEFARKTAWSWPEHGRFYSAALGPVRSAAVALCLALAAGVLEAALFQPWRVGGAAAVAAWAPYPVLAFPVAGAARFLRRRTGSWPAPAALCFVVFSYLTLLSQALLVP